MNETANTSVSPSAILRAGNVPLPSSVAEAGNLQPGDTLYVSVPGPERIVVSRTPSCETVRSCVLPNLANLPLGPKVLQAAKLQPGMVVSFKIGPTEAIHIDRIDEHRDRGFVSPERDKDGRPIPPGWLAQAFMGLPEPLAFIQNGRPAAELIIKWATDFGLDVRASLTLLDFGCGCGRVARHMPDLIKGRILGCDLRHDAIEWCQKHMRDGEFFPGRLSPPMPIETNSVDLLYAVSVLTHLDCDHQLSWLNEWKRAVKPNGLVLATFNGDDFVEKHLKASQYKDLVLSLWKESGGIAFVKDDGWAGVFPDAYQTTYHTFRYVKEHWSEFFEVLDIKPSGAFANRQNCAILRKRN